MPYLWTVLQLKNDNAGIGTENPLVSLHNNGDFITKGPWVDIRAFGATGDGSTDDSPAFTAALNNSFGNRTIVVPAGGSVLNPLIFILTDKMKNLNLKRGKTRKER